jgi:hypothetical protein
MPGLGLNGYTFAANGVVDFPLLRFGLAWGLIP